MEKSTLRELGATYCGDGIWELDSGGYVDTILSIEFFDGFNGELEWSAFLKDKRTNHCVGVMSNRTDDEFRELCRLLQTFPVTAKLKDHDHA